MATTGMVRISGLGIPNSGPWGSGASFLFLHAKPTGDEQGCS